MSLPQSRTKSVAMEQKKKSGIAEAIEVVESTYKLMVTEIEKDPSKS